MSKIISFCGKMGSGKTTLVDIIKRDYDSAVIKFAQPLYDIQTFIYATTGLTLEGPKDRKLLQWLGTDWGRGKDENLWVNIFKRRAVMAAEILPPGSFILNDDLRFDNEAKVIKELGGLIIEVSASPEIRSQRIPLIETGHSSELGVSDVFIDARLTNNGSLQDLKEQLEQVLTSLGLRGVA